MAIIRVRFVQVPLPDHLIQGEVGEQLHKFRVRLPEGRGRAGEQTGQGLPGVC